MRIVLMISFLMNIALVVISYFVLPDMVAIHFGRGGLPNSWASNEFNTLLFVGIDIFLLLIFIYGPQLKLGLSAKRLSIPNKDYWLVEENRAHLKEILTKYMLEFGCAIFVFMFAVSYFTLDANLSEPVRLNERLFLIVFVGFMFYVVYWTIRFLLSLRIPKRNL